MEFAQESVSQVPSTPTANKGRKEAPWKLIIFCTVFVLFFVVFTCYAPAKNLLYEMEDYFKSQGWFGRILFVLLVGCVVVPLGLPYTMFQIVFVLMVDNFWTALILTSSSQVIGASICFYLTRYVLKEKLGEWLKDQKIFKGIESVLHQDPFRFSLILNLTNIPLIVKNYALAMPDSISYPVYISTAALGAVFTSAPQIYLFQEAEDYNVATNATSSTLHTAFTVFMTLFSVFIVLYVFWYTKKLLSEINVEAKSKQNIELVKVAAETENADLEENRREQADNNQEAIEIIAA